MAKTVCFTCGMALGEPLRLNRLENGQLCPSCRDRVLDLLPSILPDLPRRREESFEEDALLPPVDPDEFDVPPTAS